jgi:putative ABC transport system ATP-binding protein
MPLIEAHELYRFFHTGDDETAALRGVSLIVGHGEIVAITGPSGSGKSTLLACLSGLDEPDGGYVAVAGERITHRPEAVRGAIRAQRFGILQQSGNLFQHLTVFQNIELQMRIAGFRSGMIRADEIISIVDLDHRAHGYPDELSGGETARAGLAVALATDPVLVIADEPTAEVDIETEERLICHFKARRSNGKSTLIATHSPALAAIADRTIRLRDGRLDNE